MVGDCWPGDGKTDSQLAHACLAALVTGNQAQQAQSHRITEGLKPLGQHLSLIRRQRLGGQRRAAARHPRLYSRRLYRHRSILTDFKSRRKVYLDCHRNSACKGGLPMTEQTDALREQVRQRYAAAATAASTETTASCCGVDACGGVADIEI